MYYLDKQIIIIFIMDDKKINLIQKIAWKGRKKRR